MEKVDYRTMKPEGEDLIRSLLKGSTSMLDIEDIVLEAVRDLLKDEIKKKIRTKLDEDPELRNEIKEALEDLFESKLRETYALLRMGKCGAKLSMELLPKNLKDQIGKEIASILESEFSRILESED